MSRMIQPTELVIESNEENRLHGVTSLPVTCHGKKRQVTSIKVQKTKSSSWRVKRALSRGFASGSVTGGEPSVAPGNAVSVWAGISTKLLFDALLEIQNVFRASVVGRRPARSG